MDNVRVACLSGIVDLQIVCQKAKLQLSAETNNFLLYQTLKKVGPWTAQKLISKLVERGEIQWETDENFEVEYIIDHGEEDGVIYYLIKWKDWNSSHNSWEPVENIDCPELIKKFNDKLNNSALGGKKRRLINIESNNGLKMNKKRRVDEIFAKLLRSPIQHMISPLHLLSLSSPKKGKFPQYKGLVTGSDQEIRKVRPVAKLSTRSKAYKEKRVEVVAALKEWEKHLNSISTDPAPIVVENEVDLEGPPENFEYIVDYREGEGVTIPQDPLIGCECEDCYENRGKSCCPAACGTEFAYYKWKRVKVPKGTPIYECNKRCKCGPECPNRVVQHGRQFKVCIFRTANGRGWGVKALQKIKKGSFVMEYVGEVINNEEAERRGKVYDAECRTYLFDLDYNDEDCPYTVDAGYYGNASHFVNHSCEPNLEVFGVWINTLDPRMPRIALFAKMDISRGEELTFDYMMTGDTTLQTLSDVIESVPSEDQPVLDLVPDVPRSPRKMSMNGSFNSSPGNMLNESFTSLLSKSRSADESEDNVDKSAVPNPAKQLYRMVCQCGAPTCRKYLF